MAVESTNNKSDDINLQDVETGWTTLNLDDGRHLRLPRKIKLPLLGMNVHWLEE
jgi:hypothetical protein